MYLFTENTCSLYVRVCIADFCDKDTTAGWMLLKEICNVPSTANQYQMCLPNFFWFYVLFWFYVFKCSEGHKAAQVPLRHQCAWRGREVQERQSLLLHFYCKRDLQNYQFRKT